MTTPTRSQTTPDGTTILVATDLVDKFGFGDGELLEDAIDALGIDSFMDVPMVGGYVDDDPDGPREEFLCRAVLKLMVERHLAPLLIGIGLGYDASLSHNPVRANSGPSYDGNIDEASLLSALQGIIVEVERDEMADLVGLAIARTEVAGRRPAATRLPRK